VFRIKAKEFSGLQIQRNLSFYQKRKT